MKNFKQAIVIGLMLGVIEFLIGCGSTEIVRTPETDPQLRVFLDPRIPVAHYVQIRRKLVETRKFEVIDRNEGFEAALREQELQHGYMGRRFSDKEKWAWVGEFYGAAAVITATPMCFNRYNFWGRYVQECKQELALINASTGKVEMAVAGKNQEDVVVGYSAPDWDEVVQRLSDEYPKYYKPRVVKAPLDTYMDQSVERAQREREFRARKPASQYNAVAVDSFQRIKQGHDRYVEQQQQNEPEDETVTESMEEEHE